MYFQLVQGSHAVAHAPHLINTSIRDINQFESANALKAYFGIYPRRRQSGTHESKSKLAKHGNRLVRHDLWNAACSASRYNPVCRELYERLVASGKHEGSAYGAVARKLLEILYGVLKHNNRSEFSHSTLDFQRTISASSLRPLR